MNPKQKFELAKITIITTSIGLTLIAITWLCLVHKPSYLKAAIRNGNQKAQVECNFMDNENLEDENFQFDE